MGAGRERKLVERSAPLLEQGEQIELIMNATLGKAPVAKNATAIGASAVASAVSMALGGGVGFVGYAQKGVYLVLTDRQLLFFQMIPSSGGPGKHLASMSRAALSTLAARRTGLGIFYRIDVANEQLDKPLRLTVAPFPLSNQRKGPKLAAALTRS